MKQIILGVECWNQNLGKINGFHKSYPHNRDFSEAGIRVLEDPSKLQSSWLQSLVCSIGFHIVICSARPSLSVRE
jgi:hypothetical protein